MRLRPLRLHLSSCHYKFSRTNSDVLLLMFLTEDEINDSPIEQVRLTIPITDDPTLPTFTFRTWVLGPITCGALAFVQQFFDYRQNPIAVSSSCFKMLLFVLGKFMAATLPSKPVKVPGTKWTFSMNPGPFNIKEHVVVSILATTGLEVPFGTTVMGIRRIFYHKYLNFWIGLLMIMTSQVINEFARLISFFVFFLFWWIIPHLFDALIISTDTWLWVCWNFYEVFGIQSLHVVSFHFIWHFIFQVFPVSLSFFE